MTVLEKLRQANQTPLIVEAINEIERLHQVEHAAKALLKAEISGTVYERFDATNNLNKLITPLMSV